MMATDPIATLRTIAEKHPAACDMYERAGYNFREAIAELERRARIEARLDKYVGDPTRCRSAVFEVDGDTYRVALWEGRWDDFYDDADFYSGPDRWSALEAALNAAGAP